MVTVGQSQSSSQDGETVPADTEVPADAGTVDTGAEDAGTVEAGAEDTDAGTVEAGAEDAETTAAADTGPVEEIAKIPVNKRGQEEWQMFYHKAR